jgi:acetate CoA/acetoacetate CoA-transferase beta subunit
MIPGKKIPGMGGAMDLLSGAKIVILAMEHTANGTKKILSKCTLPLTAAGQVNKIITEMGVMDITSDGIVLRERNADFSIEDIQSQTEATLIIDKDIKVMEL